MLFSIEALINQEEDLFFCGSSNKPDAFLENIREQRPDVVVLDVALYASSGLDLIGQVRNSFPEVGIIVLSVHREMAYVQKAIDAGAQAYVMKTESPCRILAAIRAVLQGDVFITEQIDSVEAKAVKTTDSPINKLSSLELEILQDIGKGLVAGGIAQKREMELAKVEDHIEQIQGKLALTSQAELFQYAAHWVHHEGGFQ